MNVYAIQAYGNYGGGMAIVAANDENGAKLIASEIRDTIWRVDYGDPSNIELLPVAYDGEPRVLTHYETGE